jgi:putative FmdB family regulatory protein
MPTYEFSCHKCELIFEHIYPSVPKKIPQKRKCPECGKLAEKMISAGVFHMKGKDYKMGKTEVMAFYNEAIKDSRNYLQNMPSPYRRYQANAEHLMKTGQIRKLSDSEIKARSSKEKKVAEKINETKLRGKK